MPPDRPLIGLEEIEKIYYMGGEDVHALKSINLEIERNSFIAIMGPSGSGNPPFDPIKSRPQTQKFLCMRF